MAKSSPMAGGGGMSGFIVISCTSLTVVCAFPEVYIVCLGCEVAPRSRYVTVAKPGYRMCTTATIDTVPLSQTATCPLIGKPRSRRARVPTEKAASVRARLHEH